MHNKEEDENDDEDIDNGEFEVKCILEKKISILIHIAFYIMNALILSQSPSLCLGSIWFAAFLNSSISLVIVILHQRHQ